MQVLTNPRVATGYALALDYGRQVITARARRDWSQEALARASGLSRATVVRMGRSINGSDVSPNSALQVLQSLASSGIPASSDEIMLIGKPAGIDDRIIEALLATSDVASRDSDRTRANELTQTLVGMVGPATTMMLLSNLITALRAGQPGQTSDRAGPQRFTVKHPPVDKGTHTEHVEVDYEIRPSESPKADTNPSQTRKRKAE